MAFNFINGIQIGGDASVAPHAHGPRHTRRMLWTWMVKVIGYQDIEKTGAFWDNPQLSVHVDGATSSTDSSRFSSVVGGFTAAMEGSFLLVFPTAAPATSGGFTDATRNGFYRIKRVLDANTVAVEIFNGVHSDGLPLGESGVRFEVHDFRKTADLPVAGNDFIVRGTGAGGTFDARWHEDYADNFAPTRIQMSPFADWAVGSPGAFVPATRLTTVVQNDHQFNADIGWVWAIGDLTQIIVWVRYFNTSFTPTDGQFIYMGDFTPFHPANDLRPVGASAAAHGASLEELANFSLKALGADDLTAIDLLSSYLAEHAGSALGFHDQQREDRSQHSGRFVRSPIIQYTSVAGNEEIRGQLKNVDQGHFYGPRGPVPFGTALDRIRFFTQFTAPWNGSKIFRYVY